MTTLHAREALERLRLAIPVLDRQADRLHARASEEAVRRLGAIGREPADPAGPVLDAVRERILAAAASRAGIASLSAPDLRHAPWLLWSGTEPLASNRGLLELVVRRAARSGSTRRNLINAWLRGFHREAPRIGEAGQAIRRLLADTSDLRMERWRAADRAFGLFDPNLGPKAVAEAIVGGPGTVDEVLGRVGLDGPLHGVGGYAGAVQGEVLALSPGAVRSLPERRARVADFLAPNGTMRFGDAASLGAVARALVHAWLDGGREPSADAQADIQAFLLQHLRDPRVQPENWRETGKDAIDRMRSWLDRASFAAFFDLIDEYSSDRQFLYRRAFWSAYLERGIVSRIWLALGSQVHREAKSIKDLRGAYGRLVGAGGRDSIMLMEVGDTILCEWSNVGRLRAWSNKSPRAPELYKTRDDDPYRAADLRSEGLNFPASRFWPPPIRPKNKATLDGKRLDHDSPEVGYWQSSAAEFIARRTGKLLTPEDWMPAREGRPR